MYWNDVQNEDIHSDDNIDIHLEPPSTFTNTATNAIGDSSTLYCGSEMYADILELGTDNGTISELASNMDSHQVVR